MQSPPIGILTRNRAAYLDVTLRSLSATRLPNGVQVSVFDDASDDQLTQWYYDSDAIVSLDYKWPTDKKWVSRGFGVLPSNTRHCRGIYGRVRVVRSTASLGVVTASCNAVRQLFAETDANGVFLLQDDVIFNENWYDRMLHTVMNSRTFTPQPVGVLAGIKLNRRLADTGTQLAVASGITAQCLYISRAAFDNVQFLQQPPAVRQRFDDLLRRSVMEAGMWGGVIYPFVCQHIGVKSLVRPKKRWAVGKTARIGFHSVPPYAMTDEVRQWG